jgi:16S rRNA (guanine527-N7)-methyltransferase
LNDLINALSADKQAQLEKYFLLLTEWNQRFNLTSITEKADVYLKHFEDSLTGLKYIKARQKVLDIGSGAGFPGIVLKIAEPSLDVTLIDGTNKKIVFLQTVIDSLQLKGITAQHIRAEDAAKNKSFAGRFDIVTARAVASLDVLIKYSTPLLKSGGKLIAYKGADNADEIAKSNAALKKYNAAVAENAVFSLGELGRSIVVVKKL